MRWEDFVAEPRGAAVALEMNLAARRSQRVAAVRCGSDAGPSAATCEPDADLSPLRDRVPVRRSTVQQDQSRAQDAQDAAGEHASTARGSVGLGVLIGQDVSN